MFNIIKPLTCAALASITFFAGSCASGPNGTKGIESKTDARKIDSQSRVALDQLYKSNPKALQLAKKAKGVLVFPSITKAGFVFGGAGGDGALYQRGKATGFYRTLSASWGLQAGIQKYSYALFLMDDQALQALNHSGGWDLGSNPNLVVVDKGGSGTLSTTTIHKGTYMIAFDQTGLMAGIDIQGTKITRLNIHP
ncbi:twin-arginine translocation pathway signal protein [Verrucomicrobiaceae bacterium N1E253]|uniref:Twin-arginine translocation pathway signal protein n=1 Tax=Oceaniferula marina TaxID=2748318 RepID=A0A851GN65_9BACT|nr:YSC84-related protein [Oceaniferula marina]NWK55564.1 twin-arginine translocation pathway signal protein [Oceaniferula marina]